MRGLFLITIAAMIAAPLNAQVKLSDFYVDLSSSAPANAIYAANEGGETLYLKVDVAEVLDPSAKKHELHYEPDPRKLGLLVSPQRLVLAPGEEGRIRLVALTDPDRDKFYKISVVPVTGSLSTESEVGVKVMIGYTAWAWIRPEGARPIVSAKRTGTKLILRNNGETLARMMMGKQCAGETCESIEPFRLLAGQDKTLDLPFGDRPVSFRMIWGEDTEELVF